MPYWDVERIVAEVVQRLEKVQNAASDDCAGGNSAAATPRAGTLTLSDRVISLATLGDQIRGVDRLQVPRRSVLTPAVLDLLRQHGICLERQDADLEPRPSDTLLLATSCLESAEQWFRSLAELGAEHAAVDSLANVVATLAGRIPQSISRAIILTGAPALAACQSNRHGHLRAAVAVTPAQWQQAVAECRPNVMVTAPTSEHQLRQLTRAFSQQHAAKGQTI